MSYLNVTLEGDFSVFKNVYPVDRNIVEYRKVMSNDDECVVCAIDLLYKSSNCSESINIESAIDLIEEDILRL